MVYSGLVDNIAELFEYQAFIFDYLFKPIAYDDQSSNTYTLVDIMIKLMTCFEVCLWWLDYAIRMSSMSTWVLVIILIIMKHSLKALSTSSALWATW